MSKMRSRAEHVGHGVAGRGVVRTSAAPAAVRDGCTIVKRRPNPAAVARLGVLIALASALAAVPSWAAPNPVAGSTTAASEFAAPLRSIARSGRLPGLRWPAFPEFRAEVERLYERAAWQPMWLRDSRPTAAANQLIARLAGADSLGLEPADYDASWLAGQARELATVNPTPPAAMLARFDVGLSVAAVRFVSALHRGRVSPSVVHGQLFIPRAVLAVEMAVDSLRDVRQQGGILERLQPHMRHYQLLKNGLARYRTLARDSTLIPIVGMPRLVKPGVRLAVAPRLRRLLEATGDIEPGAPRSAAMDSMYSPDLVAGVKKFQLRQGFKADGVIGSGTRTRLDRPFSQRVRQIELALERFRWLPVSFSTPPIFVNIPAFRLFTFGSADDRENDMLAMDVVVGGSFDKRTPVFAADMKYLILRPYWEVPMSIMRKELGPKARREPGYLEEEGMVLLDTSPGGGVVAASSDNLHRIGNGVRVRQLPGPSNALGLVKFIMPNAHDVYLHDTPGKAAFEKARRDLSHGCVRLSDPVALATYVLRDQPEWSTDRIRAAMEGEDNHQVNLSHPIPVCIVYATAIARENDDVYFYTDIYGLDQELDHLLVKGYPYPK